MCPSTIHLGIQQVCCGLPFAAALPRARANGGLAGQQAKAGRQSGAKLPGRRSQHLIVASPPSNGMVREAAMCSGWGGTLSSAGTRSVHAVFRLGDATNAHAARSGQRRHSCKVYRRHACGAGHGKSSQNFISSWAARLREASSSRQPGSHARACKCCRQGRAERGGRDTSGEAGACVLGSACSVRSFRGSACPFPFNLTPVPRDGIGPRAAPLQFRPGRKG